MFGSVGGVEIVLILVLALILFGPRKLPKIGRTLGNALSEFRRATTDFRMNLEREVELGEIRKSDQEIKDAVDETPGVARDSAKNAQESSES